LAVCGRGIIGRMRLKSPAAVAAVLATATLAWVQPGHAQSIEPRAYSNIPIGVNFLIVGLADASGGLVTEPSLPLEHADLRTDALVLAYARGMDFHGHSGKFDIVVPYVWIDGSARYLDQPVQRRVDGFGDPRLRLSINLHGAPALPAARIASYRQDTIVGLSVQVVAPLGQYDGSRLVNIGTNRWQMTTELGVSKAVGDWTFEVAPAATFFSVNEDFYGGHRRAQEPVYSLQGSVIYGLRRGMWMALSGTYYTGGKATVDGNEGHTLLKNSLLGATFAVPLDRRNSIKFYASTGLVTRIGSDADTFSVAWQHRWGAGL
jgi:hypothetical protein